MRDGQLEGQLALDAPLQVAHPIRVAVVWLEGQFSPFNFRWQSLLVQGGQQLVGPPLDGSAGPHSFSASLARPPEAALRVQAGYPCNLATQRYAEGRAALVVFVDMNENGRLDIADAQAVDHVLTAGDFPFVLLGHAAGGLISFAEKCSVAGFDYSAVRLPLLDDARLDLASCAREDRFARDESCGVSVYQQPAVVFVGQRVDEEAFVEVGSQPGVRFALDGQYVGSITDDEQGLTIQALGLAVGSHRLRAEKAGARWEASFTLPDATGFKTARRTDSEFVEVDLHPVAGATSYWINVGRTITGTGVTPPIRLKTPPTSDAFLMLGVGFGELPFRVTATQKLALP